MGKPLSFGNRIATLELPVDGMTLTVRIPNFKQSGYTTIMANGVMIPYEYDEATDVATGILKPEMQELVGTPVQFVAMGVVGD